MNASLQFDVLLIEIIGCHTLFHNIVIEPFSLLLNIFGTQSADFKVDQAGSFCTHGSVWIPGILLNCLITEFLSEIELSLTIGRSRSPFSFWW